MASDEIRYVKRIIIESDEEEVEPEPSRTVMEGILSQHEAPISTAIEMQVQLLPSASATRSATGAKTSRTSPTASPVVVTSSSRWRSAAAQRKEAWDELIQKGKMGLQALSSPSDVDDGEYEEVPSPLPQRRRPVQRNSNSFEERPEREYDIDDGTLDDFIVGSDEERDEQYRLMEAKREKKERRRRQKETEEATLKEPATSIKSMARQRRSNIQTIDGDNGEDDEEEVVVISSSKRKRLVADSDEEEKPVVKTNFKSQSRSMRRQDVKELSGDEGPGDDGVEEESEYDNDKDEEEDEESEEEEEEEEEDDEDYGQSVYWQVNAKFEQDRDAGLDDVMSIRQVCGSYFV